jgi:hypothetical protein
MAVCACIQRGSESTHGQLLGVWFKTAMEVPWRCVPAYSVGVSQHMGSYWVYGSSVLPAVGGADVWRGWRLSMGVRFKDHDFVRRGYRGVAEEPHQM